MAELVSLYAASLDELDRRVRGVAEGAWHQPTPCAEWDVRDVVNHVVGENLWVPELLGGRTIAEVGDRYDGDVLGSDPVEAWSSSAQAARTAASAADPDAVVHLSFGDVPAREYLWQLTTDATVHAWDVARGTGQAEGLEDDLVGHVLAWFREQEEAYRGAGVIGPMVDAGPHGGIAELLGRFGRDPSPAAPLATVVRFNLAFGAHDLDAIDAAVSDDVYFVDTSPPDGRRHEGRAAVRAAFAQLFEASPDASFTTESGFVAADRVVEHWLYQWGEGETDHVRGIDVFTTRDGLVTSKQSYVKG